MRSAVLSILAAVFTAGLARGETLVVDPAQSVFAVLTHKAGIASGLAHDHLVTAPQARVTLSFDKAQPEATRATFKTSVTALEIDHFAPRARWKGRLHELGAGPKELAPIAESDRKKVRDAMLGEGQLDAEKYPEIHAELVAVGKSAKAPGPLDWTAKLKLTVHGKSVERELAARWSFENGTLSAEALGEFRFTEFGIEPYSAALGAVKNQDRFHVYVSLVATAKPN